MGERFFFKKIIPYHIYYISSVLHGKVWFEFILFTPDRSSLSPFFRIFSWGSVAFFFSKTFGRCTSAFIFVDRVRSSMAFFIQKTMQFFLYLSSGYFATIGRQKVLRWSNLESLAHLPWAIALVNAMKYFIHHFFTFLLHLCYERFCG